MKISLNKQLKERKLKILIFGDKGVGKSTILKNFIKRNYKKKVKIIKKKKKLNLPINIEIEKRNILGDKILIEFIEIEENQEKRENLDIFFNIYLKEKSDFKKKGHFHGIFYFFDINDQKSLYSLSIWIKFFHDYVKNWIFLKNKKIDKKTKKIYYDNFLKIPIFFVANKFDLFSENFKFNFCDILKNKKKNLMINVIEKINSYILSYFSFDDLQNIIFMSKFSENKIFDYFDIFIIEIYNYFSCNNDFLSQKTNFSFLKYNLGSFKYLDSFKIPKKIIRKITKKVF